MNILIHRLRVFGYFLPTSNMINAKKEARSEIFLELVEKDANL